MAVQMNKIKILLILVTILIISIIISIVELYSFNSKHNLFLGEDGVRFNILSINDDSSNELKVVKVSAKNVYDVNFAKDISVNYWSEGDIGFITTGQGDECNFTMANTDISFRHYPDGLEFDLKGTGIIPKMYYACNNEKALDYFSFKTVEKEINYSGKLQAFDYSIDIIPIKVRIEQNCTNRDSKTLECLEYDIVDVYENLKGGVSFALKSKYVLSLTDEWNVDPIFQLINITENTIKENIKCEEGGQYCHILLNDTSLTAYYAFDVNTTTLRNWIGDNPNGRDVTFINTAKWGNVGKFGGGLNLTIKDDWAQIGSGSDGEFLCANPSGCALALWVKHVETPPYGQHSFLLSRTGGGNDVFYQLRLTASDGGPRAYITDDGVSNFCLVTHTGVISDNDWHHFGWIYNNVTDLLYSCLDGTCQSVACDINIKTGVGGWGDNEDTLLGSASGGDQFWHRNNSFDEVMIFNRSITPAELTLIYNAQYPRYDSRQQNNHTIPAINITSGFDTINVTLNLFNQNNTNISLRPFTINKSLGDMSELVVYMPFEWDSDEAWDISGNDVDGTISTTIVTFNSTGSPVSSSINGFSLL